MNFAPIAEAPLAVKIHLATVVPAFLLGTWQIFFSRKGAPMHRAIGVVYLVLMTVTRLPRSSFASCGPGASAFSTCSSC